MSPWDYVDLYCERLAPGLWAEPLNAVSNGAFFVAAWLAWRALRAAPGAKAEHHDALRALPWLMLAIGAGSFAFHTLARVWAAALDSGAIALFMLLLVCAWLRSLWHLRWAWAWLGAPALAVFVAASTWMQHALMDWGSQAGAHLYVSSWLALLLLTVLSRRAPHATPASVQWFVRASVTFAVAIALRQLDLPLCSSWPSGTHWAWHVLNGTASYFCIRALLAARSLPTRR